MTETANFKKQQLGGADVATILDNENETLEVVRRTDGTFELIIHNRRAETDTWDDLSVTLKPAHFSVLGSISWMAVEEPPLKDKIMVLHDQTMATLKAAP